MEVKVVGKPSAGAAPEIQPDIKTLGTKRFPKHLLSNNRKIPKIQLLALTQRLHCGYLLIRNSHEVPHGIGIPVEHQEAVPASQQHEVPAVVRGLARLAEEIRVAGGSEIFRAPRRPKGCGLR